MKKSLSLLLMVLMCLLVSNQYFAQSITAGTYSFTGPSGFAPDVSGTTTELIPANSDNIASAVTDIGFTFWFAGTAYTQFSVNENGLMTLGSTQISGSDALNSMSSATTLPKIAPYWDDLATGTNGSVYYKLTGSAPNRTLVVTWNVTVPKAAAGAANSIIQVQLSEAAGTISFTYGYPAFSANPGQYSIGIGVSPTDFASVTPVSASSATVAYGTANDLLTIAPNTGGYKRYTFTPDAAAPTITHTALNSTTLLENRTLTATIADPKTGIPTSGSLVPRIYYRKNNDVSFISTPGTLTAGTGASGTWNFTIDYSLLGGVSPRDAIYYFIVAQDQSAFRQAPNVASLPAGAVAANVNTVTAIPSTLYRYKIGANLSGTITVGSRNMNPSYPTPDFSSLTNADGVFEDINIGILTGDLTIKVVTPLGGEAGTYPLNAWANGNGGPFKVSIVPEGDILITGSNTILKLNGTNGVTIDGLGENGNSLTISSTSGAAVQLSAGASNNTIKRATLVGSGSNAGVIHFYDASGSFAKNCSDNTITNCTISPAATRPTAGIYFGSWVSQSGTNNVITNNIIKDFNQYGIHLDRGYSNFTISNNEIFQTVAGNYSTGIYIYNPVGTANIFNNKIYGLRSGTNSGVWTAGIYYRFGGGTDILNIYNNVIHLDAASTNTASAQLYALQLEGAGTANVYYNSIYIGGTGVTTGNSAGLFRTGTKLNFMNNIIFNARSLAAPSQYSKNYGIKLSNLTNLVSNNNVIYANGIGGILGNDGTADRLTISDWKTATGKDANSYSGDPGFISPTNLKPDSSNTKAEILDGKGALIASIGSDIEGKTRNTVSGTTDIGAYEFTPDYILISGNTGVGGVTLSWTDNTPKTTVSDEAGNYSLSVSQNWTGSITPSKVYYNFTPVSRDYSSLLEDQTAQDYTATPERITANLKVFLHGPFDGTLMTTLLNSSGLIPLRSADAYSDTAYSYTGSEVTSIPNGDIVDWVLVELRTGTAASTRIAIKAAFLKKDGTVTDTDGISPVSFTLSPGNYYIVIRHRNHLPVMTASPAALSVTSALYDFTTAQSSAYGTNALKDLGGTGIYGMFAGDVNANGRVSYNGPGNDRAAVYIKIGGTNVDDTFAGYCSEDVNLNGFVSYNNSSNDRAVIYQGIGGGNPAAVISSQVPD